MSRPRVTIYLLMFAAIFDVLGIAAAQGLRELAREHARKNPGAPLHQTAPPGDYWPKTIEELAKEADLVMQAKLSRTKSYLSDDRILTDYSLLDHRIIAGHPPQQATKRPGPIVPLILTVYGGEVTVDGVLIRGMDNNRDAIIDGGQYLLFLRPARPRADAGRYEIHYGGVFEITEDKVKPLLHRSEAVFKGTVNGSLEDLTRRIKAAVRTPY